MVDWNSWEEAPQVAFYIDVGDEVPYYDVGYLSTERFRGKTEAQIVAMIIEMEPDTKTICINDRQIFNRFP